MNTEDKELLELAAKAAGIELTCNMVAAHLDDYERTAISGTFVNGIGWNPLSDDGDALRLAVTLNLLIDSNNKRKTVSVIGGYPTITESFVDDGYEATRRAIVRAAAQIGKEIK